MRRRKSESTTSLMDCAELILPWLTPQELANVSLTSKPLSRIATSVGAVRRSDAARGTEAHPIPFITCPPHHRRYSSFLYTPSSIPSSLSSERQPWPCASKARSGFDTVSIGSAAGCGCDGGRCGGDGCPCGGDVASECGSSCGCGSECGNRASQRGVWVSLKIVWDEKKGWCLFARDFIPQNTFVCEYAGELLTTEEARRRQQKYDQYAKNGKFSSALLVVREHLPSRKACLRLNIDATRIGNVGRFINHSCDGGNLSTVLVRSSGALLPRLCFFASEDIGRDQELTFSYGGPTTEAAREGSRCYCGASSCFGRLPSEQT